MLNKIHLGHLGKVKSKLRASEMLFWTSMSNDIDNLIESCETCLTYSYPNRKEPLFPNEIPDISWSKVGIDCFQIKGSNCKQRQFLI